MAEDSQLLSRFTKERSESAFGELVTRHLPLVYSTALRQTAGDAHLAKDISQLVFADLARKAPSLSGKVILAGWLHRGTIFAARQILRGENRRCLREQHAVIMNAISSENESADWQQIRPILDEALDRLDKTDRDALLLRFFEQQSLAQIGTTLGGTEDAVRKRIARALEKLRAILQKRGVTTTAAVLSATISTNAIQLPPVELATTLAYTSLTIAKTKTAFALLKIMTTTQLKITLIAIIVATITATLVIAHQSPPKKQAPLPATKGPYRSIINLVNVPFAQFLPIYIKLCNGQNIMVETDASVESLQSPLTLQTTNTSASECIQLIEKAFRDQAGVEANYLATNHVILRLK
jgi:RNA polymerase sigma factor (sigma-70 family)